MTFGRVPKKLKEEVEKLLIIEEVKKIITDVSEDYKSQAEDKYDYWNEHIKYVYEEAIKLADKYNADREIVGLGSLLHDIALVKKVGDRKDHHINGEILAREVLESFDYPDDKKERVLKCVLHHRSSRNAVNNEELCVADSDILAHFDNIPMLFDLMFNAKKMSLEEVHKEMPNYLEKDFEDLSDRAKQDFKSEYELFKKVLID